MIDDKENTLTGRELIDYLYKKVRQEVEDSKEYDRIIDKLAELIEDELFGDL